ncbi:hypothetical protein EIB18_09100 [Caulobacter vibrioides]|uniref:Uncharacterized protein n=3 Tax=Caulobacter vibrioides TaxID=155892 RepID=Q9A7L0_CAUVC|nr:hypothetical protein [Caulobacter vibrioides]YP_002517157.1 hypothetical protein CCNA_01784 [Caulobacter vibrioides NA1000]AAK23688.1 hypothetical protein CC_1712 [Caulobacter vibrioides CB15]QBQ57501.1 hypothetical protein EUX21_01780 [synthetic Caulobacter sp. 'ethensis']ACL95249.1 hypothetical protein CCNA_01784 [Caulobacter vibrioides NA1000]ATC28591.1 hypothetical protein CA607_09465 [Caulobacter vibrioides]AZH12852.1 hypothetical protein EIB18_09100 [Caulobacter vibrioides]
MPSERAMTLKPSCAQFTPNYRKAKCHFFISAFILQAADMLEKVIRPMRAPWDRRGTIHLQQLPNNSPSSLKKLSDEDLTKYIAGWKPGTAEWITGDVELKRRQNGLARLALGVSVLSLLVSIAALFVKGG